MPQGTWQATNSNRGNKGTWSWCHGAVVIMEGLSFREEVLTLGDTVPASLNLSSTKHDGSMMETRGTCSPPWLTHVNRCLVALAGTLKCCKLLRKGCGKG